MLKWRGSWDARRRKCAERRKNRIWGPFSPTRDVLELPVFEFAVGDACKGEPSPCDVEEVSFFRGVTGSGRQTPGLSSSPKAFGNSNFGERFRHVSPPIQRTHRQPFSAFNLFFSVSDFVSSLKG